ncbi:MAG: ATP-dependent RNA helicase HrpA [Candidatus Symbiodolus clandestinus]
MHDLSRNKYPAELPVTQHREQLLAAIASHPVVVVAGDTGSGKTTQLPKICLELGLVNQGIIGHTQPRRLAARMVAQRLAEELQGTVGGLVGYQVRLTRQLSEQSLIKVMTDGVLLAEIQQDRQLHAYSVLIIDEAHERSLTIDLLLGYIKQLLPKRPDLKVIITSATLDPQRFCHYFNQAPLISISGRTYPVEVRYRPVEEMPKTAGDPYQALIAALQELFQQPMGDILIFLSGEREIREVAELLQDQAWPQTEIVPLYARLSIVEQQKAFQRHSSRQIILATNVAETSLTIPGIRYVIDLGKARISRYNHRHKIQQLPIEAISQASANQRKGRCGRVAPGICIRLYSEADFLSRSLYTEPAILRTNLAAIILQMLAYGLLPITQFPFLDPPDQRYLQSGLRLLQELGAITPESVIQQPQLTPLGRQLSQLPLDPRLARMLLAAHQFGCLQELLIITSALSIQDPREWPSDRKQAAEQRHQRFADQRSDFLSWLSLWHYLQQQQQQESNSAFRRRCRSEYLHHLRIREWQDLYLQLRQAVKRFSWPINQQPADYQSIHCALLSGLLSHVGQKSIDKPGYRGARQLQFFLFPNSVLFKTPPPWVVVAELVTTSRHWGRTAARVEPTWLESLAKHLLQRRYSEPYWDARQGGAVAQETVTLYGLPIVSGRRISYGKIDPKLSRELLIRHALIDGEWHGRHRFWQQNQATLATVEILEQQTRRRGLVVDSEFLFAFYDQHLPADIVSVAHFDRWWRQIKKQQPQRLTLTQPQLFTEQAATVQAADYPTEWVYHDRKLPLQYQFSPGDPADGVTVQLPLALLPALEPEPFEWLVAGFRVELLTALIKGLPKQLRRNFLPIASYVEAFLQLPPRIDRSLLSLLAEDLARMTGVKIPSDAWQPSVLPAYLKMRFAVIDETGTVIAEGRDLKQLQLQQQAQQQLGDLPDNPLEAWIGQDLQCWDFGDLPILIIQRQGNHQIQRFPTLVEHPPHVTLQLVNSQIEQQKQMLAGSVRLIWRCLPNSLLKTIHKQLDSQVQLALLSYPDAQPSAALEDCLLATIQQLLVQLGGVVWEQQLFQQICQKTGQQLVSQALPIIQQLPPLLNEYQTISQQLQQPTFNTWGTALTDMRQQLGQLIYPGFIRANGVGRLADLLRYLKALRQRLEKLPCQPAQDQRYQASLTALQQAYQQRCTAYPAEQSLPEQLQAVRWMLEELRVSYFAQTLGTAYPISEKRLYRALQDQ